MDDRGRSWGAAKASLLGNVNVFIDGIKAFKSLIEVGDVPPVNMKDVRRFLVLEHFQRPQQHLEPHSTLAAILASWAVATVSYYDAILAVEPKRGVLHKYLTQLAVAKERLQVSTTIDEILGITARRTICACT